MKRLRKRATKAIDTWTKKYGREPKMSEIKSFPVLSVFERIGFFVLGGCFLLLSYWLITIGFLTFPLLILLIAGYVTLRGLIGHELKVRNEGSQSLATPDGLVLAADSQLTNTGRKLLALDICLLILWFIFELIAAAIGALASALG